MIYIYLKIDINYPKDTHLGGNITPKRIFKAAANNDPDIMRTITDYVKKLRVNIDPFKYEAILFNKKGTLKESTILSMLFEGKFPLAPLVLATEIGQSAHSGYYQHPLTFFGHDEFHWIALVQSLSSAQEKKFLSYFRKVFYLFKKFKDQLNSEDRNILEKSLFLLIHEIIPDSNFFGFFPLKEVKEDIDILSLSHTWIKLCNSIDKRLDDQVFQSIDVKKDIRTAFNKHIFKKFPYKVTISHLQDLTLHHYQFNLTIEDPINRTYVVQMTSEKAKENSNKWKLMEIKRENKENKDSSIYFPNQTVLNFFRDLKYKGISIHSLYEYELHDKFYYLKPFIQSKALNFSKYCPSAKQLSFLIQELFSLARKIIQDLEDLDRKTIT